MAKPKLYSHPDSGNCYKIILLASLLNIELEVIDVDMYNDKNLTPEYLAINPRASIPALVDGDKIYTDSAAILIYLAGTYGHTAAASYWSTDPGDQASIVDWLSFECGWINPGLSRCRYILSFSGLGQGSEREYRERRLKDAQVLAPKSLRVLETQLEKGEWLAAGRPTIADISVFPYVALAPMGDISLEPYPAVRNWIARVKVLKGFITMIGIDDPGYKQRP